MQFTQTVEAKISIEPSGFDGRLARRIDTQMRESIFQFVRWKHSSVHRPRLRSRGVGSGAGSSGLGRVAARFRAW